MLDGSKPYLAAADDRYTHTFIYRLIRTCTHPCMCTYAHTHIYTRAHTHTMHIHTHTIIHAYIHLFVPNASLPRPRPSQPFTPYSTTLGGVVREIHRSLLLTLAAETHPAALTQIVKVSGVV